MKYKAVTLVEIRGFAFIILKFVQTINLLMLEL